MHAYKQKEKGFSIVEIIVAMAIMIIIASSSVGVILQSFSANRLGNEETEATLFAQEGIEAVRSIKKQDWANVSEGTYGVDSSGGSWTFSDSSNSQDGFTREIIISSVERDSNGNIIESGGAVDEDAYKVTSRVSWDFTVARNNFVELVTYLTNFVKPIAVVGDWSSPGEEACVDVQGGADGLKIDTAGDYAFAVRGGGSPNFVVVNISDTSNPSISSSLTLQGLPQNIIVANGYAYITSRNDNEELQIIDVSNPNGPGQISSFNAPGNEDALGIDVEGNIAYIVRSSGSNEFITVDISNPSSPSLLGSLNLNGDNNNEVIVIGNYAYIASSSDNEELRIVNVSNPSSLSLSGTLDLSEASNANTITGFTGNVILGRENGTVHVVSVSNPSSPNELGTYNIQGAVRDLSLGNNDDYVFVGSDYNAGEFQVVNISSPTNPTDVGIYDVTPDSDINGIKYHIDKDRALAAGEDNNEEICVIQPGATGTTPTPLLTPTAGPTPTSGPTATPTQGVSSCNTYCQSLQYSSGTCTQNPNKCENALGGTYESGGDQYCTGRAQNICCCQ